MKFSNRLIVFLLSLLFVAVAVVSRLKFNGLVFGFDYGLYQPDGANYTYRTLMFLGYESNQAASEVTTWYKQYGFKNNLFEPSFLLPSNTANWDLVQSRIFYSFLSVPFVYLFGIQGMLVIPIISFLIVNMVLLRISFVFNTPVMGLFLIFLLTNSPTVLRWMIANLTDSVLTAIFSLTILVLYKVKTFAPLYFIVLVILSSMTRFCLPIWLSISFVLFLNKRKIESYAIIFASITSSIPTIISSANSSFLPNSRSDAVSNQFISLVTSFFKVGFIEIAQLAVIDRLLLMLLIISIFVAFTNLSLISSQYFIGVFFSVWLLGAINGTLGVNFRYQLPLIGFMVWVLLDKYRNWPSRN